MDWEQETPQPVFVPKPYREIIGCALWYQEKVAAKSMGDGDVTFAFVCGDEEGRRVAGLCGVFTMGVGEWGRVMAKKGQGGERRRR